MEDKNPLTEVNGTTTPAIEEEEELPGQPKIDPEHPWVEASLALPLGPVPTTVRIEPTELVIGDIPRKAALLTTVTSSGVQTVFINPSTLAMLVGNGQMILAMWEQEEQGKIQLATAGDVKAAVQSQVAADRLRHGV
jgi:hypothetical protein